MTTSIHTNTSAMIALQNLNRTSDQLASTQSRVNTGLKVQGAKDNAAVWAVAQGQRADKGSLEAVTTSLNRATSIADVSLAAGEQISDILLEMKQKATAAADPSQTAATRASYYQEFQALTGRRSADPPAQRRATSRRGRAASCGRSAARRASS